MSRAGELYGGFRCVCGARFPALWLREHHWSTADDGQAHGAPADDTDDSVSPRKLTMEQVVRSFAEGCGLGDDEVFEDCIVTQYNDAITVEWLGDHHHAGTRLTVRFTLEEDST